MKMKQIAIACITLASVVILTACGTTSSTTYGTGKTLGVAILRQIEGSDAGFREPGVRIINNTSELETLGSQLLSLEPVNFADQSMIVLALGEQPTSGYAVQISGVQQAGDALFVQGTARAPSPDDATETTLTYPVAAVIVSKVRAKAIHSEIEDAPETPDDTDS